MTPRWTPEEIATLREHYPRHGGAWDGWAKLLPGRARSGNTIAKYANHIGLRYEGPRKTETIRYGRNRWLPRDELPVTPPRTWGVEPTEDGRWALLCDGEPTGKTYKFEQLPSRMRAMAEKGER